MQRANAIAAEPSPRAEESRVLYGDSSPFPYGIDFLDATRALVDCCVAMLTAQGTIDQCLQRSAQLEQALKGERWRLDELLLAVRKATSTFTDAPPRVGESAAQVLATARTIVERERAELDRQLRSAVNLAGGGVDEACSAAYQALEALLLAHIPPDTAVAWRVAADDDGYDAQVHLATRFGLDAQFGVAVPDAHRFGRARRVADLQGGTTVRAPRPGRPGAVHAVSLDKLFLSELLVEPERIVLFLRKNPRSGPGYRVEVHGRDEQTAIEPLDELGQPDGNGVELTYDDREPLIALASAVLDASFDLVLRRQLMTAASLDRQSLRDRYEPREVCARLLGAYGPIVAEIGRRSGSPRELTLRKDVGNGRREAVFVTRAELLEKIGRLPAGLRAPFAPLGL